MNIALLIDSLAPGGSEGVVQRLAIGLAQRGETVRIYCLREARCDASKLLQAGVIIREANSSPRTLGILLRILDWLRRDKIDLVHTHSCSALVAAFPPAKLLRLPIINVRHGWPPGPRARHTQIADWLSPWIDQVVINSESGRPKLRSHYLQRHAVHIPNGLEPIPSNRSQANELMATLSRRSLPRPLILTIANLRVEKGIRELLRSFATLRQKHPNANLAVVGRRLDEAYAQQVDQDVKQLGLTDNVHFLGPVPEAQKLMSAADVYCLSSTSEAMPNVILEAMAQQIPIVATRVGDVDQILQDGVNALLAKPNDPEELAKALDRALCAPAAAAARADAAMLEFQQNYRTDVMVKRYSTLYERILNSYPRHAKPKPRPMVAHLGPPPKEPGGMVTSIRLLMQSEALSNFAQLRINNATSQSHTPGGAILNHLRAFCRLAHTLITRPIEVLHIHTCSGFTFYRNIFDAALARLFGINVVWHVRGGKFANFCRESSGWSRRLIQAALTEADRVIALSPKFQRDFAAFAPSAKIVSLPNAFDPGIEALSHHRTLARDTSHQPTRFLYLASLRTGKGIHELLTAAEQLYSNGTDFELVLLGKIDHEEGRSIQRKLDQQALKATTRWLGLADAEMKHHWLKWADVFVHPSHSEGLPNAVLEAAASGLPVIATDVGAVRDVLQPTAATEPLCPLIPAKDAQALAGAMQFLAKDHDARHKMGDALCQHVRNHHHIEQTAAKVSKLYLDLIGRKLSSPASHPERLRTTPARSPQPNLIAAAQSH